MIFFTILLLSIICGKSIATFIEMQTVDHLGNLPLSMQLKVRELQGDGSILLGKDE